MFRQPIPNPKKTHHGTGTQRSTAPSNYPHRLNFYTQPPTKEITLDEFEQWAIDRLRILGEFVSCTDRGKTDQEIEEIIKPLLETHLNLHASSYASLSEANRAQVTEERKKDHYSHFILRLAFSRSDDLRTRFCRAETFLFRLRFNSDDTTERQAFLDSLSLDWDPVSDSERLSLADELSAIDERPSLPPEPETFFKVDWERVTKLVEQRRVYLRAGKAYVPSSLKLSLVATEFSTQLNRALELTARALPRLDEDDRLLPILNHLSHGFTAPEPASFPNGTPGTTVTAASIDSLVSHFPLCMTHLHKFLRRKSHLGHFSRRQYGLFLKAIGLSVDESLIFWRTSFNKMTDDQFKEHRYQTRYIYGLEGARKNAAPLSCQQILVNNPPGVGDTHGCPYRHFSVENLMDALTTMGVTDEEVLNQVKEDVGMQKYHIACNKVFEYTHKKEIKRDAEDGRKSKGGRSTIGHPNEYYSFSWELKNPGLCAIGAEEGED